jgi:hypothetical protein
LHSRVAAAGIIALALSGAPFALQPSARVIGLLPLPQIFDAETCGKDTSEGLVLRSAPDSSDTLGSIRVDCQVLIANQFDTAGTLVAELPTREVTNEGLAAVVVEQRSGWFRVRLAEGTAWTQAAAGLPFVPLEELVLSELAYLTEAWDGTLAPRLGAALVTVPAHPNRRLIGYLTPVMTRRRIPVQPGQDAARIEDSFRNRPEVSSLGVTRGADGTVRVTYEEAVIVDAFERPDTRSPVLLQFPGYPAHGIRGTSASNPRPIFVFDRRPGWFQVARSSDEEVRPRTREPRVWLRDTPAWVFSPVTDETERSRLARDSWGPEYHSVRVVRTRSVAGRLWLRVELLSHSVCESIAAPVVVRRGWMTAHDSEGEPTVWFSSRGC